MFCSILVLGAVVAVLGQPSPQPGCTTVDDAHFNNLDFSVFKLRAVDAATAGPAVPEAIVVGGASLARGSPTGGNVPNGISPFVAKLLEKTHQSSYKGATDGTVVQQVVTTSNVISFPALLAPVAASADSDKQVHALRAWGNCSLGRWRERVLEVPPSAYDINWQAVRPPQRTMRVLVWQVVPAGPKACGLYKDPKDCFMFCTPRYLKSLFSGRGEATVQSFFRSVTQSRLEVVTTVRSVSLAPELLGENRLKSERDNIFGLNATISRVFPDFQVADYDAVIYTLPPNYWRSSVFALDRRNLDYSSTNSATKRGKEIFTVGCDFSTMVHEIGHMLGLEHAGARVNPADAIRYKLPPFVEYFDVSSVMSAQFSRTGSMHGQRHTSLRGLSSFQMYKLGGIAEAQIATVTEGRSTLRLRSLSSNSADDISAARVVLPAPEKAQVGAELPNEKRVVVWLEWRESKNQDRYLDVPLCATEFNFKLTKSLLVRKVLSSGITALLAVVPPGKSIVINQVLFKYDGKGVVTVDFGFCKTAKCAEKETLRAVRKLKRNRRGCESRRCANRAEKGIRQIKRLQRRVNRDDKQRRKARRQLERCGAKRQCRKTLLKKVVRRNRRMQRHVRQEERIIRKALASVAKVSSTRRVETARGKREKRKKNSRRKR